VNHYKNIDDKITLGYQKAMCDNAKEACDVWLEAWDLLKAEMIIQKIQNIMEMEEKYIWKEPLYNFVQDLDEQLHNAAIDFVEYFQKKSTFAAELLERLPYADSLLIENTRRSMAEAYYQSGNKVECDRLFQQWLDIDPLWGYGYLGWAECYFYDNQSPSNLAKAEQIMAKALLQKDIRDLKELLGVAVEIYTKIGNAEMVRKIKQRIKQRESTIKIGRNDACPCGSGKKYKKCCGNL
jgi:hypothetical protein